MATTEGSSRRQMKSKSSIDWTALVCIPQTIAFVVFENILRYSAGTEAPFAVFAFDGDDPTEVFSVILRTVLFLNKSNVFMSMVARAMFNGQDVFGVCQYDDVYQRKQVK